MISQSLAMKNILPCARLATVLIALCIVLPADSVAQSKVSLQEQGGQFELKVNGQPYQIKGVGGTSRFAELAAAGGNSIRTWGTEGVTKILDEAQSNGLTVCVGMWLQHERHGFDYGNQAAVKQQHEQCLADVRRLKDHPAVLMWGIGNEMEGDGNNPAIWQAVNKLAVDIKKIDPNHPTITVIAELGENNSKIKAFGQHCPDVDIIGINSYGGIPTLAERFNKAGVRKPYVVTEHGPIGPWETAKTPWGSAIEATSTEKGRSFASGYKSAVTDQKGTSLGSYAFLWGHKQETTATWFGMLLADGSRTAAVDAMSEAWTGVAPANRCPEIQQIEMAQTQDLKPGATLQANVTAKDPESDTLTYKWVLTADSKTIGEGGDAQDAEALIQSAVKANGAAATVTVPETKGSYRLFAYVYDGKGGAAVTNLPLFVDGKPAPKSTAPKAQLPFAVYADSSSQTIYTPSGYMGNATAVSMDLKSSDNPHTGKTCLKAVYNSRSDWGGVLWQSPADDWDGTLPGGANLTGATALEFWARGAKGGETVNFVYGVLDGNQPFRDTAKGELSDTKLTKEWKKYSMPLNGKNLSRIKTGFGWSLAGQGSPVTFYLDDIQFTK